MKFPVDQCIAGIIVIGCIVLLALGIDGEVKSILTMAAGWCFGSGYMDRKKR